MLKKLSNIQKDKLLHFFWGSILSFILILYCGIVGMIIALIIPAVKELYYDKYLGKGNCEWADYFYSIAPTIMLAIMKYQWLNLLLMQDILTTKNRSHYITETVDTSDRRYIQDFIRARYPVGKTVVYQIVSGQKLIYLTTNLLWKILIFIWRL